MKDKKKQTGKPADIGQDLQELTELLQRTRADFENYRRRAEEGRAQLLDYAKAQVVKDLLPLIDDLERALAHLPKELAKNEWAKGVVSVSKRAQEFLGKMDAKRIGTVGEPFDPNLHEAISVDGDGEKEIVSHELQAGYRIGDEVIRPAIVRVKRGK
jgi:molecular chaperone GrpE